MKRISIINPISLKQNIQQNSYSNKNKSCYGIHLLMVSGKDPKEVWKPLSE